MNTATISSNINDHFFNGQYKEVWRRTIPPGLTEAEVDFIEEVADLKKHQHLLDAMCGYGRHALELGQRGYSVTAIDNATTYIEELNEKATKLKLPVNGRAESMMAIHLETVFDAIICMGNSFAFFTEAQAINLLHKFATHLMPGGKLIINTWMIAEIAVRHFKEREWHQMTGYKYLIENKFFFQPTRIESVHTVIPTVGTMEEIKGVDYIFSISELEKMFAQNQFVLKEVYSTPRKKKFALGDGRAYIVAEKI